MSRNLMYLISGVMAAFVQVYIYKHWGDTIAGFTGYYFVVFLMPLLAYLLIASPLLLGAFKRKGLSVSSKWIVGGVLLSYAPTFIFLYGMSASPR